MNEPQQMIDVFDGTAYVVSEIDSALADARLAVAHLRCWRDRRELDGMNEAHAELTRLIKQSRLLSESLGRVIQFHVNRRKAQS